MSKAIFTKQNYENDYAKSKTKLKQVPQLMQTDWQAK